MENTNLIKDEIIIYLMRNVFRNKVKLQVLYSLYVTMITERNKTLEEFLVQSLNEVALTFGQAELEKIRELDEKIYALLKFDLDDLVKMN